MMVRALCTLLAAVAALPALAQQRPDVVELPEGCEAFVTVQSKDCTVDHNFICEADPPGLKQRLSLDQQGMTYLGATDEETQWIRSFRPRSGTSDRLEDDPADRASLTELIETGIDTYDFRTLSDEVGPTRYVGFDTLTGRTVEIDGVVLTETNYAITAYDAEGEEIWSSEGQEFINPEWRMFLAGPGTVTLPGETFDEDDSPVEFIFPGEPGFLSANPKYGCGETMSSLQISQ